LGWAKTTSHARRGEDNKGPKHVYVGKFGGGIPMSMSREDLGRRREKKSKEK